MINFETNSVKYMLEKISRFQEEGAMLDDELDLSGLEYIKKEEKPGLTDMI